MSQASTSPRTIVYKATRPRTFKACRTCRLQKARCIIDGENPPCKRCNTTGRDCVFEELGNARSSRKRGQSAAAGEDGQEDKRPKCVLPFSYCTEGSWLTKCRYLDPGKEITQLRELVNGIHRSPGSSPQQSHHGDIATAQSSQSLHSPTSEHLNKLQLEAPITAVHAMTSNSLPPSPASLSIEHHSTISASPKNTKLYGQPLQPAQPKYDDIISRGILKESEGRKLFQLYVQVFSIASDCLNNHTCVDIWPMPTFSYHSSIRLWIPLTLFDTVRPSASQLFLPSHYEQTAHEPTPSARTALKRHSVLPPGVYLPSPHSWKQSRGSCFRPMQRGTGSPSATHIRWARLYSYPIFFLERTRRRIPKTCIPNSSVIGDPIDG